VKALEAARATLESHGDHANVAHARYLEIRRLLLIGRLDEAEAALVRFDPDMAPPVLRAIHELALAGIAMRRLRAQEARAALERAARAARLARIPALMAEVEAAEAVLRAPAARLISRGTERTLSLAQVEQLLASDALVVDACRYLVRDARHEVPLARRPVLFVLARALAEAWPGEATRVALVTRAFRARAADESYRARLRVELGRLRAALRTFAAVNATPRGFQLVPHQAKQVVVLAPPVEEQHAAVLAFLADGESWSSSALALALRTSQRSVQRALDELGAAGKVTALGRGRARRWTMPPMPGFATSLLLSAAPSSD
jgi:DNA-binding transcriptional ArsR family regulator